MTQKQLSMYWAAQRQANLTKKPVELWCAYGRADIYELRQDGDGKQPLDPKNWGMVVVVTPDGGVTAPGRK